MIISEPLQVRESIKDYKYISLCKGDSQLIPYNTRLATIEEHAEKIIKRLQSPSLAPGQYEIKLKTSYSKNSLPDIVLFHKAGKPGELSEISSISDKKFEIEAFKLKWINEQQTVQINDLQQQLKELETENTKLQTENEELNENEALRAQSPVLQQPVVSGLSESIKAVEPLLTILAPILSPLLKSHADGKDLENQMKMMEFKYQMRTKYSDIPALKKETEQPDELQDYFNTLKKVDPATYEQVKEGILQQVNNPQQPNENDSE
jgi:hypothetical protein